MTDTSSYRRLNSAMVVETAGKLADRVQERFPEAGLAKLAAEVHAVAEENVERSRAIRRPIWSLRVLAAVVVIGVPLLILIVEQTTVGKEVGRITSLAEFVQTLEASLGAIVFLGAAIFFVVSLEARIKRGRALDALAELRSLAHIVDMHQLPKGPERLIDKELRTASSPRVDLDLFHMERYLDYCSEMLSIIGKVAALYIQGYNDSAAVGAVDEIEALTTALSRKIWQKITLVQAVGPSV